MTLKMESRVDAPPGCQPRGTAGWYTSPINAETENEAQGFDLRVQDWRMRDRLKTVSAALAVSQHRCRPPDQLPRIAGASSRRRGCGLRLLRRRTASGSTSGDAEPADQDSL